MACQQHVLLRLHGIERRYGAHHALEPVDLTVHAGECVTIVGPNGAGKSTLLRIAGALDRPDGGTVAAMGADPGDRRFRRNVFVLEDAAFYPDLTVREHLELVAVGHGAGEHTPETVALALAECGLSDHADLIPHKLSKGLQQRMLIAGMMARPHTRLLILDEPEHHLDPHARKWLIDVLLKHKKAGSGILVATHHLPLVEQLSDRSLFISGGKIQHKNEYSGLSGDSG